MIITNKYSSIIHPKVFYLQYLLVLYILSSHVQHFLEYKWTIMTVILIIIRLWVLQRFLAVTEGFACSEDVTAELERRSGAGAVMRSCSDSHVPGYMHALMCVRQCVCDSSSCCDLEASHVSPLGPWKGGLMQSSCICVCYSGSAISLECSTSCQNKSHSNGMHTYEYRITEMT